VTLFDVYECAINPPKLEAKIAEGEELFPTADYISIDDTVYVAHRELSSTFGEWRDRASELLTHGVRPCCCGSDSLCVLLRRRFRWGASLSVSLWGHKAIPVTNQHANA
jgi:hypothetical protein